MNELRDAAYQIDPVLWVREVLGVEPTGWQETFLRAQRGASILALTARQVGKTATAAWAIAHTMLFVPGSLSVIACPAQRQSAEAVRRVREALVKAGAELESDNDYTLAEVDAPPRQKCSNLRRFEQRHQLRRAVEGFQQMGPANTVNKYAGFAAAAAAGVPPPAGPLWQCARVCAAPFTTARRRASPSSVAAFASELLVPRRSRR